MLRITISDTSIERLPDAFEPCWYGDKVLKGFQIAIGQRTRTFYAVGRLARANKVLRVKVGAFPAMSATEARRKARRMLSEMSEGHDPRRSRLSTLRETLEDYISTWTKRERLSEDTADQYRKVLELHCPSWLDKPLNEITPHEVKRLHDRLSNKRYTANQLLRVLRQLYKHVRELDPTVLDPTGAVKLYKEKERRSKLQLKDLAEWYKSVMTITSPYRRNYHLIAIMTGIRRENLATMEWRHVNFDGGTVYLPKTKSRRTPTLPLSAFVVDRFKELKAIKQNGYVFWADSRSGHIAEPREGTIDCRIHDYRKLFTTACGACLLPNFIIGMLRGDAVREDVIQEYMGDIDLKEHAERVSQYLISQWTRQVPENPVAQEPEA